jgi:ATP-dependent Lhr-like helicase
VTSVYLEVTFDGTANQLELTIRGIIASKINLHELPLPEKIQVPGKYNEFVPQSLLRKQFVEDYLDFEGLREIE